MSDLGQLLKKARIEKGISLDELQDVTKIRKRYLEAIEEGDFKALPGNFYVRAFIRTYAESVGLDPGEVLVLYRNVIPSPHPEANAEPVKRSPRLNRKTERWSKWASGLLFWCFLILIISIIWYYINSTYEPKDNVVENPAPITDSNDPIESPAEPPPPVSTPEPEPEAEPEPIVELAGQSGATYTYDISHIDALEVELIFDNDCWVEIRENDVNGKVLYEKTHKSGDRYEWSGDTPIRLRLGFPMGATVIVNGVELERIESRNAVNLQLNW